TAHLAELRSALARELTAPEPPTELFVPVRNGGWWYLDRPRFLAGHGMDVSLSRVPDSADLRRDAHGIPVLEDAQLLGGGPLLAVERVARYLARLPDGADRRRDAHGIPVLEDGQLLEGEQMLVEDRRQVFAIALSAEHQLLARAEAGEGGCHITVVDLSTEE